MLQILNMNSIVLLKASSRINGDTNLVVNEINKENQFDVIDLQTKDIGHYNYTHSNAMDDFLPLMETILKNYNTIIFATPVYWYSMSGILKVFFDRLSDLLQYRKDLGKQLKGKRMAMISISNADDLKDGFTMPFIETAAYLEMHYLGAIHTWVESGKITSKSIERIQALKSIVNLDEPK